MIRSILFWIRLALLVSICSLLAGQAPAAQPDDTQQRLDVDFSRTILPILSDKCFVCHGPDAQDSDMVRLDSYMGATQDRGGYRAINPDSPEDSEILNRILDSDDPMPPEDAEKQLTDEEKFLLRQWVLSGGDYSQHWAFVPPQKEIPNRSFVPRSKQLIDEFIGHELEKAGQDFSPAADKATLARRVSLVLIGLPPDPRALERFLNDDRPDAYERFVDRLLQDPRFGEHQARYWLDAVRYGDTHGLHLDNRRGIFPYRDWVVRALNEDLPLDDFITWQLAGDLLPEPSLDQLIATGFVRMNPSTSEGGVIPAEFQAKNNFDRVETLGTVLLGMTLTCARCHTHKYDPVPQIEYYELMAFFNSTAEGALDGNAYVYGPAIKTPTTLAEWTAWQEMRMTQARLIEEAAQLVDSGRIDWNRARQDEWRRSGDQVRFELLCAPGGPFQGWDVHDRAVLLAARQNEAEATYTTSLIARDLDDPRPTRLLRRGEYDQPIGDPVEPDVLSVMGELPADAPRDRLGLAQWLTARNHPVVARVLVNRMWQQVFGDALVRSPEDFGLQGQQPTHPELLDWLAVELHDADWDYKHMMRLMVTSRTFRQSSAWRPSLDDPENRLFGRGPRYRLDAEVLRDIGLWSSGLLDPTMGGEGVKPYQPRGMWLAMAHPASNTKQYVRDTGAKLYRRSLYVYWKRTSPHPMMTLFDAPDRESSCVRRGRTNTMQQSLGLLNETSRIEMARHLAQRLLREERTERDRVDRMFRMLACRPPTEREREICRSLLEQMKVRYRGAEADAKALLSIGESPRDESLNATDHAAWTQVAVTVLASDLGILLY